MTTEIIQKHAENSAGDCLNSNHLVNSFTEQYM